MSVDATFTQDEMPGFDRSALQQILESMTAAWLCEISAEAHMVEASSPVVGYRSMTTAGDEAFASPPTSSLATPPYPRPPS